MKVFRQSGPQCPARGKAHQPRPRMNTPDRRHFLKLLGAGTMAGALPDGVARAMEIPAHYRKGTIEDVEHIIIITQENRSFDHYFGTLRGVRGFADPRAITLPSGKPVWFQPNGTGELLPFRPPVKDMGMTFVPDPPHGWNDTHAAWNGGNQNNFPASKGVTAMTYHKRSDIPYHFALADAFTICDAYHCSLMGPTDPNRYHLWTGWCGNNGQGGGPVITNAELGYDWSSYPERLQAAGISWKVYQDIGVGLNAAGYWGWTEDPFIGNYGDNALLYLHQYQYAAAGSPLANGAKTGTNISAYNRDPNRLFDIFREDVRTGKLPQVSYITAPEAYSEHPNFAPDYGAWYVSQIIDILSAHPEVFSKTVVFLNYDEEGGFFDHMVPPTPPQTPAQGDSTVSTKNEIFPGDGGMHVVAPYGLGMRVPMLVISPWSKGGWVNSQVFDHTSLIRFLEARFARDYPGLIETNITPWRRAVTGDLTSAFDFSNPDPKQVRLPRIAAYKPTVLDRVDDYPVAAPATQSLPQQEKGVRPARAVPYDLQANGSVGAADGSFRIRFQNSGRAAAVFHVRSAGGVPAPRSYTVEPNKELTGVWAGAAEYDLSVHGPNGFYRRFKGGLSGIARAQVELRVDADGTQERFTLSARNLAPQSVLLSVVDQYSGKGVKRKLEPRDTAVLHWSLKRTAGWYDIVATADGDTSFRVQFAGHVESGEDSISDPAMGGVRADD